MLLDITMIWKKRIIILIAAIAVILAVFMVFAAFFTGDTIRKGIEIEGKDVSGLKASEARLIMSEYINGKYPGGSFTLKYGQHIWNYSIEDISYRFLIDDAVNKAYSMGRAGSIFQKLYTAIHYAVNKHTLEVETNYDKNKLNDILKKIKSEIDIKEKNAAITYEKGVIKLSRETVGSLMDIDINMELLENQLKKRNFDNIQLQVENIQPEIRYDDIKNINSDISYFYTKFNTGDVNRSDNIRLACSRINGRILLPDDIFSMNEALGPRTLENGYKEAPVIFKDELVAGTGGGICQVTTTLYNTVLKARLSVLERTHHSMPLGYVKPGQDATIAEDSIDFKFQNNLDYPICLAAEVKGNTINIRILGPKNPVTYDVRLIPQIMEEYPTGEDEIEIDDTLKDDQKIVAREARKGVRVILYRDTYGLNGILIKREQISEDYYKPVNALIKVNRNYYNKYYANKGY